MSRLGDKVDKNRNECITIDRDLSKRIGKNFERICDHREESVNARQLLSNKINAVSERLDETATSIEEGDADYQNLDSRIKALEDKSPVAEVMSLQDGNKRLLDESDSLRADNEGLQVRLGIMQRCNANQAKMIRKFRRLASRVLDSCNLGDCDTATKLLEEINDELS